jgi:hypothetical protein
VKQSLQSIFFQLYHRGCPERQIHEANGFSLVDCHLYANSLVVVVLGIMSPYTNTLLAARHYYSTVTDIDNLNLALGLREP